jgi:putative holliday junction resolvase
VEKNTQQLMAFDFGTKHIGIAVGQTITCSAEGIARIDAHNGIPDWQALDELVTSWKPDAFVVGLPLNMDGSSSPMSQRAKKFANRIADRFNKKVFMMDERLSSREVKEKHREKSTSRKPQEFDSLAAAVILQSWFASQQQR